MCMRSYRKIGWFNNTEQLRATHWMCMNVLKHKQDGTLFFLNVYPSHSCTMIRITPWLTLLCLFIITPSLRSQHKTMPSWKKPLSIHPSLSFPFLFHFLLLWIPLCCHILSIFISCKRALKNLRHRPWHAHHIILKNIHKLSLIWSYTDISIL